MLKTFRPSVQFLPLIMEVVEFFHVSPVSGCEKEVNEPNFKFIKVFSLFFFFFLFKKVSTFHCSADVSV